ncbi:hypothetical protein ABKV19_026060 [Rosa sericea]
MNLHEGYGFVEFPSEEDADYISFRFLKLLYSSPIPVKDVISDYKFVVLTAMQAVKVLNMIKLYGKTIRVNKKELRLALFKIQAGENLFLDRVYLEVPNGEELAVALLPSCFRSLDGDVTFFVQIYDASYHDFVGSSSYLLLILSSVL